MDEMENRVLDEVDASIEEAYYELERKFRQLYARVQAEKLSLTAAAQTAAIMQDLGGLLSVIDPAREEEFIQRFEQMISDAHELGGVMAEELVGAIAPDSDLRQYTGIPVEAVALQARDGVQRLYRWNEEFRGKASGIIEQSLIQGWGPRRAAEQLRSQLGITRFRAETIARTETLFALNDAAQLRYQQNGVEGVQWVCTIGEVCPYCIARNGRVYETGKVRLPAHPRCRCIVVPWKALWDTDDEFMQQYVSDRLADLKQEGGTPNYGPTPFERAAGLTTAPEPIWKPGDTKPAPQPPSRQAAPEALRIPSEADAKANFRLVGQGAQGRVYVDGGVAYKYSDEDGEDVQNEIRFTQEAARLGVGPRILGSDRTSYAMEFLESHSPLAGLLNRNEFRDLPTAGDINRNLLGNMRRLHEAGIAHNDLHEGNVLVNSDTGSVRIIDYGYASYDLDGIAYEIKSLEGSSHLVNTTQGTQFRQAVRRFKREEVDAFGTPEYEARTRAAIARFYDEVDPLDLTPKRRR